MLTGKELGDAIKIAIAKKLTSGNAKSKAEIARHFGVKPPSIHDWMKKGSIDKSKLPALWDYFSDVVDAQHWGLKEFPHKVREPDGSITCSQTLSSDTSSASGTIWAKYDAASAVTRSAIDLLLLPANERAKLDKAVQAAIVLLETHSLQATTKMKSQEKAA